MNDSQTWTTLWELTVGVVDGMGREGKGGKPETIVIK